MCNNFKTPATKSKLPELLNQNGLSYKGRVIAENENPLNRDEVHEVMNFLEKYMTKSSTLNTKRSSYGIKHDVEHLLNKYVSNGNLIAAMILLGYDYEQGYKSLNCYFNYQWKDEKLMKKYLTMRNCTNIPLFRVEYKQFCGGFQWHYDFVENKLSDLVLSDWTVIGECHYDVYDKFRHYVWKKYRMTATAEIVKQEFSAYTGDAEIAVIDNLTGELK